MFFRSLLFATAGFVFIAGSIEAKIRIGFSLPDSISEYTLKYRSSDNLVILPVRINGGETLNLILDTGCRNIVLFGKRFLDDFDVLPRYLVEFSGMGSGKNVRGFLSLNNRVRLGAIGGESVPLVIVPEKNIFKNHLRIDGLIGYDIFTRFEIELIPKQQTITFRSAFKKYDHKGYSRLRIEVIDSRPMIKCQITLEDEVQLWDLLIDTGSVLGLLLKSTGPILGATEVIGKGLNGSIEGSYVRARKLMLHDFEFSELTAGLIGSPWHNYASLGMGVLKDYALVINYAQSYACLKRL